MTIVNDINIIYGIMDYAARWIARHPLQRRSHQLVSEAIRKGKLHRPDTCSSCGERARVIAHHEDYRKPLDVVWICHWCHYGRHKHLLGLDPPTERRRPVPKPRPAPSKKSNRYPGRPKKRPERTVDSCRAIQANGKRCANIAVPRETICARHLAKELRLYELAKLGGRVP